MSSYTVVVQTQTVQKGAQHHDKKSEKYEQAEGAQMYQKVQKMITKYSSKVCSPKHGERVYTGEEKWCIT